MSGDDKDLLTISRKELKEAYEMQRKNKEWDFFDERKHVENLLCKRFNYLILAFSLFVNAFTSMDRKCDKVIVLFVGLLVLSLISFTIRRAYLKLDINLKILYKLQKTIVDEEEKVYNPMLIIDKEVQTRCFPVKNMNKFIGIFIPLILSALFAIGIVAILMGWWSV